ncbi:MAG: UDP-3-O-(3-hydroxymyristoyl)glucosamine N-acyltransferase, partial [Gammaproteobacteria bacterium]|nr:UDP-3-O-(3-hydroxymyristoyl)glucosamine N-acyltransferase [Gammaproteobacteria bacterium]
MSISLGEIAARYGCELRGDPEARVSHVATLSAAGCDSVTFLANKLYRQQLESTAAAAVILSAEHVDACPAAAIVAPNPYAVYARVAAELHPPFALVAGVDARASVGKGCTLAASCQVAAGAVIEDGATLGERVSIGPNSVIGRGSQIGDDTRLMANVTVYDGVRIGRRCLLHSGCVIGADGFGIAQDEAGWTKVPQVGGVTIADDVEIGANTTIDRGAIEDTVICAGVKLDNQIQIAHNVVIGAHTAIAAQTGVSGSTTVGAGCMIGGACIIAGHLSICDQVMLAGGSGVSTSIDKSGTYGGFPG